jgi:hypothetical protein
MSLSELYKLYPKCAEEFDEYSRKRRFAKGLTDTLAKTFLKSIQFGDGCIWTDSALVTSLISEESQLRLLFESFPSYRTKALSKRDFKKTLTTTHLTINPSLQPDIDAELRHRASWEKAEIDEAGLLMLEIDAAMEWFQDEFVDVTFFSSNASKPIRNRASATTDKSLSLRFSKIANLLEDCILIAFLFRQHPLIIFDQPAELFIEQKIQEQEITSYSDISHLFSKSHFSKLRRIFFWKLRDIGGIPQHLYSDNELVADSKNFSYDWFVATCDSVDEQVGEMEEGYRRYSSVAEEPGYLRHHGYLAAALLSDIGIPKSILASRLERYGLKYLDIIWPESSKVIVSLGRRQIQVSRYDLSSQMSFQD